MILHSENFFFNSQHQRRPHTRDGQKSGFLTVEEAGMLVTLAIFRSSLQPQEVQIEWEISAVFSLLIFVAEVSTVAVCDHVDHPSGRYNTLTFHGLNLFHGRTVARFV